MGWARLLIRLPKISMYKTLFGLQPKVPQTPYKHVPEVATRGYKHTKDLCKMCPGLGAMLIYAPTSDLFSHG